MKLSLLLILGFACAVLAVIILNFRCFNLLKIHFFDTIFSNFLLRHLHRAQPGALNLHQLELLVPRRLGAPRLRRLEALDLHRLETLDLHRLELLDLHQLADLYHPHLHHLGPGSNGQ